MESYTSFAKVYDEFMDQTPYDQWLQNILTVFQEEHVSEGGKVLELGCGTGKMTRRLSKAGYQMTAIDNSVEMLEIAGNSGEEKILYVLQDMVSLELPEKMDAVISICDCINYILEPLDLQEVFCRTKRYLKEQGVFMFDMNSHFKYKQILSQNTFAEDREDASFIWDNFYVEEERINEYQLSLFIRNEAGTYDKFEEVHFQRAYDEKVISEMLLKAGFCEIKILDADTMQEPREETERLYFIAK